MRKILSTIVTLAFMIGFGFAIYQSSGKTKTEQAKQIEAPPISSTPAPTPPPAVPQQADPPAVVYEQPIQAEIVPLKGFFLDKLSENTTLHAIGVYEGENESGKDDPPWWTKCPELTRGGDPDPEAAIDCHRKYAAMRTPKKITVNIGYTKSPIVIVLMAYEPVIWKINRVVHGVDIEGIILGGYEVQTLTDAPAATPVIAYTHKTPECGDCVRGEGSFYAYSQGPELKRVAEKLLKITGKQLSSFQGSYKAHTFRIFNNVD